MRATAASSWERASLRTRPGYAGGRVLATTDRSGEGEEEEKGGHAQTQMYLS